MGNAEFFKVMSHSKSDKFYTVRHLPTGEWRCDCPRSVFAKRNDPPCKHIQEIQDMKTALDNE